MAKKDKITKNDRDEIKAKLEGSKHGISQDVVDRVLSSGDELTGEELSNKLREECKSFVKAQA